jgi:hypothetical protein
MWGCVCVQYIYASLMLINHDLKNSVENINLRVRVYEYVYINHG